jgi:hypothetical protein
MRAIKRKEREKRKGKIRIRRNIINERILSVRVVTKTHLKEVLALQSLRTTMRSSK